MRPDKSRLAFKPACSSLVSHVKPSHESVNEIIELEVDNKSALGSLMHAVF